MAEPRTVRRPSRRPVFLAALLIPLCFTGCGLKGSGVEATEARDLETFDKIQIDGGSS